MLHNVDVFSLDESEQSVYINYMHIGNGAIVQVDEYTRSKQTDSKRLSKIYYYI